MDISGHHSLVESLEECRAEEMSVSKVRRVRLTLLDCYLWSSLRLKDRVQILLWHIFSPSLSAFSTYSFISALSPLTPLFRSVLLSLAPLFLPLSFLPLPPLSQSHYKDALHHNNGLQDSHIELDSPEFDVHNSIMASPDGSIDSHCSEKSAMCSVSWTLSHHGDIGHLRRRLKLWLCINNDSYTITFLKKMMLLYSCFICYKTLKARVTFNHGHCFVAESCCALFVQCVHVMAIYSMCD